MSDFQQHQLDYAVRKALRIRAEHVANASRNLGEDLAFLRDIDRHLARAGVYPDFEASLDACDGAVLAIEVGE